ncbi:hypothetical protein HYW21_04525 [Candidatus Woesearchaeota archaeon]|nr:hypothetical protein [Candidatus Woesearchaeota archaeon]
MEQQKAQEILQPIEDSHQYFRLHMGHELRSLEELDDALAAMPDEMFYHHVNNEKNDFYEWVKWVIQDEELAEQIRNIQRREDMMLVVEQRIIWLQKYVKRDELLKLFKSEWFYIELLFGLVVGVLIGYVVSVLFL